MPSIGSIISDTANRLLQVNNDRTKRHCWWLLVSFPTTSPPVSPSIAAHLPDLLRRDVPHDKEFDNDEWQEEECCRVIALNCMNIIELHSSTLDRRERFSQAAAEIHEVVSSSQRHELSGIFVVVPAEAENVPHDAAFGRLVEFIDKLDRSASPLDIILLVEGIGKTPHHHQCLLQIESSGRPNRAKAANQRLLGLCISNMSTPTAKVTRSFDYLRSSVVLPTIDFAISNLTTDLAITHRDHGSAPCLAEIVAYANWVLKRVDYAEAITTRLLDDTAKANGGARQNRRIGCFLVDLHPAAHTENADTMRPIFTDTISTYCAAASHPEHRRLTQPNTSFRFFPSISSIISQTVDLRDRTELRQKPIECVQIRDIFNRYCDQVIPSARPTPVRRPTYDVRPRGTSSSRRTIESALFVAGAWIDELISSFVFFKPNKEDFVVDPVVEESLRNLLTFDPLTKRFTDNPERAGAEIVDVLQVEIARFRAANRSAVRREALAAMILVIALGYKGGIRNGEDLSLEGETIVQGLINEFQNYMRPRFRDGVHDTESIIWYFADTPGRAAERAEMTQGTDSESSVALGSDHGEAVVTHSPNGIGGDPTQSDRNQLSDVERADSVSILLSDNVELSVDKRTGTIFGPKAEGTTAVILFASDPVHRRRDRTVREQLDACSAIRIPRLLNSDELLNFHTAEISFQESLQSRRAGSGAGIQGALQTNHNSRPNTHAKIPETEVTNCFVGFYLSTIRPYGVALLGQQRAWPDRFARRLVNSLGADGISKAFEQVRNAIRTGEEKENTELEGVVFFPDFDGSFGEDDETGYHSEDDDVAWVLGRSEIRKAFRRKPQGGWWFHIPMSFHRWMATDLQSLITDFIDDSGSQNARELENWLPRDWLRLGETLANGLIELHGRHGIHGDTRPANVMALKANDAIHLKPQSFAWVDVGLGYGASTGDGGGNGTIAPAPTGGGRSSPFYAPERVETEEGEDAKYVSMTQNEQTNEFELRFYTKTETHSDPRVLRLKRSSGKAIRELGRVRPGDRVHVREFVLEVKGVEADHLKISRVYELFHGVVLIERDNDEIRKDVLVRLRNAEISRYKIYFQWSQATDIFGLGMIMFYLIHARGDFLKRRSFSGRRGGQIELSPSERESEEDGYDTSADERAERQTRFVQLSTMLRSRSFVRRFIERVYHSSLRPNDNQSPDRIFSKKEHLWLNETVNIMDKYEPGEPANDQKADEIHDIAKFLVAVDAEFEYVLAGLNGNEGLFLLFVYFVLSCVWREDEIDNIVGTSRSEFEPYCRDRVRITDRSADSEPAAQALKDMQKLVSFVTDDLVRLNEPDPHLPTSELSGSGIENWEVGLQRLEMSRLGLSQIETKTVEVIKEIRSTSSALLGRQTKKGLENSLMAIVQEIQDLRNRL